MFLLSAAFVVQAAAPEVRLSVPVGPCKVLVDEEEVTLQTLRARAEIWGSTGPEVRFRPDPKARYRCVERVVRVLKQLPEHQAGFVGNAPVEEVR